MPQASDEIRNQMFEYFGDRIDDGPPTRFLEKQGFKFTRGGLILAPKREMVGDRVVISRKEWHCMLFLGDEWDYGWEFYSKIVD